MESPKTPSKDKRFAKRKWILRISAAVLITMLLLLGFHLESGRVSRNAPSYYTVVVDCGSTGTRVNVYEWIQGGVSGGSFPILLNSYPDNATKSSLWKSSSCQYHCMQTEPGLDKFVNDHLGMRNALEPLIAWAENVVPRERRHETPVFVLATAGLRSLPKPDSDQVLADVEDVVKGRFFMYRKNWIRVLSGREEAYYGWVALNYKMGRFDVDSDPGSSATLGLLDLGGSSLQIVAEVDGDLGYDGHVMRSSISLYEHWIVAYSLPAFGLNEAFDRTVLMLRNNQSVEGVGSGDELRHPCLMSSFAQNYTCNSCSRFGDTQSQRHERELHSLHLVGEPDWEQCKELAVAAAMNLTNSRVSHPTVGKDCKASSFSGAGTGILNLTATAWPIKQFHALSGFFFIYNKLNLSSRANLSMVWESGKKICSNLWTGLSSISNNPNYAGQFCFRVAYMASLLEYGLCLGDLEMVYGPGDISWTLGAALVEGKFLWLNTSASHNSRNVISTLRNVKAMSSPTLLFAVLLFLLFIVYYCQIKLPMPGKRASATGLSLPSYTHARRQTQLF